MGHPQKSLLDNLDLWVMGMVAMRKGTGMQVNQVICHQVN